jgi:tetratricopeptide (TPR) repeat protein
MNKKQSIEKAQLYLKKDDYENAIAFLDNCVEDSPEELTYYWYLGLVYLLQENEELAQEIWLSIFLQGSLEEVEQWTIELINFLEVKVQENITEKKLGNAKVIYEAILIVAPDYENTELLDNLVESLSSLAVFKLPIESIIIKNLPGSFFSLIASFIASKISTI